MNLLFLFAQTSVTEAIPPSGFEAISEGRGLSISLTGMLIVFCSVNTLSAYSFAFCLMFCNGWSQFYLGWNLTQIHLHPKSNYHPIKKRIIAAIGYVFARRNGPGGQIELVVCG